MPGTAFDDFVDERLDDLLRYASVLTCDADVAQRLVQQALLRARPRWPRIVRTNAPAAHVRRMITSQYLSLPDEVTAASGGGDDMLARVAALPRRQRAALVLRYHGDRADVEIADVLGCSTGTVRDQLGQALETLHAAAVRETS